jgi:heavy metal sensor kinase
MTASRFTSVRIRLTLWYVGAMAIILALYAIGVFAFVQSSLRRALDKQLHEDFELAETLLQWSVGGTIELRAPTHTDDDAAGGRGLEVWDGRRIVVRVPETRRIVDGNATPVAPASYVYASAVLDDGSRVRTVTGGHQLGPQALVLRLFRSEEPMRNELRGLALVLALAWPAALAVAGVGGYWLARRALAPVDHMARHARRITADQLHQRLPIDTPHDEFGRLATVFNDTLTRLDDAFARLKRFTADASHELRTPLTAMRSVGEVALREHRDEAAYRDGIGSMLEEVDRLTRLVDTLLVLSRADAGQRKPVLELVDLWELAHEVCGHVAVLAEEKGQSVRVTGANGVSASADRLLLRSALVNLTHNAIKHSPEGAVIAIDVGADHEASNVEVSDTGPGIAEAHRDLIFERFYRVDKARSREHGGTGLGLAIAKWAVEANGGRIELRTKEGVGSTFRIVLPRVPG